MILLDTDHLSVLTKRQAAGHAPLIERLEKADEPLAIPIVSVEEQCKGWLAKIHRTRDIHQQIAPYDRLTEFFNFLAEWDIVSLDASAADMFDHLRKQKIRVGSQDRGDRPDTGGAAPFSGLARFPPRSGSARRELAAGGLIQVRRAAASPVVRISLLNSANKIRLPPHHTQKNAKD